MESLGHLLSGFAAARSWQYLLYALAGCTLGTLIGVLPGLGPAACRRAIPAPPVRIENLFSENERLLCRVAFQDSGTPVCNASACSAPPISALSAS